MLAERTFCISLGYLRQWATPVMNYKEKDDCRSTWQGRHAMFKDPGLEVPLVPLVLVPSVYWSLRSPWSSWSWTKTLGSLGLSSPGPHSPLGPSQTDGREISTLCRVWRIKIRLIVSSPRLILWNLMNFTMDDNDVGSLSANHQRCFKVVTEWG